MSGKRELKKQQKYYDFLSAAIKLFKEKGVENTTMHEIAAQAGAGAKTLNRYFGTRNTLILAILHEDDRISLKKAEVSLRKSDGNVACDIYNMISAYVDYTDIINHVSVWREYESVRIAEYNNEIIGEEATNLRSGIVDLIKQCLHKASLNMNISSDVSLEQLATSIHAVALLNYHKTLRGEYASGIEALGALKSGIFFALRPYLVEQ